MTTFGESFPQFEADGMVIFTVDQDISFLGRAQNKFADGTFKVVLVEYVQL